MGFSAGMMTGLLAANTALTQAQVHQRTSSHLDSRAQILETEIKSGHGDIEGKQKELEEVQEQQVHVQEMQMQSLNDASSQIGTAITPDDKVESNDKTDKAASDKAKDEANKTNSHVEDNNVVPVDYEDGMNTVSQNETVTAVSPLFLEKMADSEPLEKKYEGDLAEMARIDAETPSNSGVTRTWSVDKNGQIAHHATAATRVQAAEYEPVRQRIDSAGREAFGTSFEGAHVKVQSAARTQNPDSVGLLIRTEI